ncbi:hypothetical protein BGZ50_004042 [Haplosporangium sp. Z 11]|nr:hypothetical protein BGZ50_004042 [Haplosporangium sp. Z 11]
MRYSKPLSLAAVASTLLLIGLATVQVNAVTACDPATCIHPVCVCPSLTPPKGLKAQEVPQFVTITFDDAVQEQTVPVAAKLMAAKPDQPLVPRRNPNGCPIMATWFAQTLYSDYALIQQWYAAGNEIADHTMNHIGSPPVEEIVGNRKAINAFAGIPFAKLNGFRAPFLNYSEGTFANLGQEKFLYDSSTGALAEDAYWPYTLDHGVHNDCWNTICDKPISIPGMWEIPMHAIIDDTGNAHSMDVHLDGSADQVKVWLQNNFNRHYTGNRSPFGIYLHPVHAESAIELYHTFFENVSKQPDVWFVTNHQLLEWMKNPVPANQLADQPYMKCAMPVVGKEICNGIDDAKSGTIDQGVLEVCNFNSGPWSTCYGCPKVMPSASNPVPERVVAAGVASGRTPVPETCAMEWWDPVSAQCLCTNSTCAFTDVSHSPNENTGTNAGNGSSGGGAINEGASSLQGVWCNLVLVITVAATAAQLL